MEPQFPSSLIYLARFKFMYLTTSTWNVNAVTQISASVESILVFCYYSLTELLVRRYVANIKLLVCGWGQFPCISPKRERWPRLSLCPQTLDSRQALAFLCLKYSWEHVCSVGTPYNEQMFLSHVSASYTNHMYMYWMEHCWLVTSHIFTKSEDHWSTEHQSIQSVSE
jgi:hypothetical protein